MFSYDGQTLTIPRPDGMPIDLWRTKFIRKGRSSCWDGLSYYIKSLRQDLIDIESDIQAAHWRGEKPSEDLVRRAQWHFRVIGRYQIILDERPKPIDGELSHEISQHRGAIRSNRKILKAHHGAIVEDRQSIGALQEAVAVLANGHRLLKDRMDSAEHQAIENKGKINRLGHAVGRPFVTSGPYAKRDPRMESSKRPTMILDDEPTTAAFSDPIDTQAAQIPPSALRKKQGIERGPPRLNADDLRAAQRRGIVDRTGLG